MSSINEGPGESIKIYCDDCKKLKPKDIFKYCANCIEKHSPTSEELKKAIEEFVKEPLHFMKTMPKHFFGNPPATPHKCPVCNGSSIVPNGFYEIPSDHGSNVTAFNTSPEKCRSCLNGIIYR